MDRTGESSQYCCLVDVGVDVSEDNHTFGLATGLGVELLYCQRTEAIGITWYHSHLASGRT